MHLPKVLFIWSGILAVAGIYITASYISKLNKLINLKMYKIYQKNSLANAVSRSGDCHYFQYSTSEPAINAVIQSLVSNTTSES